MADDTDYVTVQATTDPHRFLVVVMRYDGRHDEHTIGKISAISLKRDAADALAKCWAKALQLEIR